MPPPDSQELHKEAEATFDWIASEIKIKNTQLAHAALDVLLYRLCTEDSEARYAEFDVSHAYDKGHVWTITTLRAVYREDGHLATWKDGGDPINDESDAQVLDELSYGYVVLVDHFEVEPTDFDTYYLDLAIDLDSSLVKDDALTELIAKISVANASKS